ncbi:uncharacterized protein E0L32_002583 [Thyridium curvatum]|uniref:Glucosidase 2 subunit beta n=1 Tax=Thyridium curvatum TaxID=1093900 RepID=A0A507BH84_9PEZI|nr:uncharacterized protein E0L32_002583 [Thyridium curvatum]TPX18726.1 hypothetical protein E0L32_002583 [Thyridium curvatum]
MRQSNALVLFSTFASTSLVAAKAPSAIRGVGPEFVHFYESKDAFKCIGHPTIVLKPSQVNDNSCDCPDGSDEPGTAACAHLDPLSPEQPLVGSLSGTTNTTNVLPGFWCANDGHVGAYVPFMYVNDGVCDYDLCCDGSEEYGKVGGVKCENRCGPIGKEYRRIEEERKQGKERAAKRRRTLVKEAKESRRQVEARVTKTKEEIAQLEVKLADLQQKLEEVQRSEKGKVVRPEGQGGKLGVLVGLAKARVNELRDALDKVLDQRDDLQDKVTELEGILSKFKEEYNPNFNDEGVKAAVKAWEDYAAKLADEKKTEVVDNDVLEILKEDNEERGVNWAEFEEGEGSDTDILYNFEAYLPAFARTFIRLKVDALRIWLIENGILADNPSSGSHESRLVTAARDAVNVVESDLSNKRLKMAEDEADLEKDYGADGIFRALKGKCVSTEAGEYEYELCWMDRTMQKSNRGHGHTNMGNFVGMEIRTADDEERQDGKGLGKGPRLVMQYENGQGCWNGPNRKTDVWLACAETEELWRVSESEKCVYKMEVGTPAACEDVHEPGIPTKDEL